jgi:hypothetical protein
MMQALFGNRVVSICAKIICLVLISWSGLAACSTPVLSGRAPDSFVPPTAVGGTASPLLMAATPIPTSTPRELRPTPTPTCTNILSFLEDVTIPDGTVVQPGTAMDKRWRLANSGTCNWDERYRLQLASGSPMGVREEQALYPARSGAQIDFRLVFTAPLEPGIYRSAWQAYDPAGIPFGDQFFIEIVVEPQAP